MSVDLDKIHSAILTMDRRLTITETKQSERHEQNQLDMKSIKKTIGSVIALKAHVYFQWFFIGGIFVGIVTLFIKGI